VRRLRAALEDLEPSAEDSDLIGAALAIRQMTRVRSLVVLCTDLEDPHGDGQLTRAVALLRARHEPIVATLSSTAIPELQAQTPVRRADAYVGLAADAYADSRDATRTRLRLAGVPVVFAPVAHFESALLAVYDGLRDRRRI
jgi:uncharacterized protein (DUF58 family)